jgi:hypothetical protein
MHRAVNIGSEPFEGVTAFFLESAGCNRAAGMVTRLASSKRAASVSYEIQVEAMRRNSDPNEMDKFIAHQLKERTREQLLKHIKY